MSNKRSSEQSVAAEAVSGISGIDGAVVARAYRKVMNSEELTQAEREALKRHERQREEKLRWKYYRSIPQKHWKQMSGRQAKVINEQAVRYDLPFAGATVDLPAVVKALHDFLADNAAKLARDDDAMLQGGTSPALERFRERRADIAGLDLMERQQQLLPRDEVKQALGRIAAILRGAGDTLQQQFGAGAAEVLFEALDDAQREIDRSFDKQQESDDGDAPDTG